jgi:hypothetical protein
MNWQVMMLLPRVPCGPMTVNEYRLAYCASLGEPFKLEELHVVEDPGKEFIVTFFSERAGAHVLIGCGSNYAGPRTVRPQPRALA